MCKAFAVFVAFFFSTAIMAEDGTTSVADIQTQIVALPAQLTALQAAGGGSDVITTPVVNVYPNYNGYGRGTSNWIWVDYQGTSITFSITLETVNAPILAPVPIVNNETGITGQTSTGFVWNVPVDQPLRDDYVFAIEGTVDGAAFSVTSSMFAVVQPPRIDSVSPPIGHSGTVVTINGRGLNGANCRVRFATLSSINYSDSDPYAETWIDVAPTSDQYLQFVVPETVYTYGNGGIGGGVGITMAAGGPVDPPIAFPVKAGKSYQYYITNYNGWSEEGVISIVWPQVNISGLWSIWDNSTQMIVPQKFVQGTTIEFGVSGFGVNQVIVTLESKDGWQKPLGGEGGNQGWMASTHFVSLDNTIDPGWYRVKLDGDSGVTTVWSDWFEVTAPPAVPVPPILSAFLYPHPDTGYAFTLGSDVLDFVVSGDNLAGGLSVSLIRIQGTSVTVPVMQFKANGTVFLPFIWNIPGDIPTGQYIVQCQSEGIWTGTTAFTLVEPPVPTITSVTLADTDSNKMSVCGTNLNSAQSLGQVYIDGVLMTEVDTNKAGTILFFVPPTLCPGQHVVYVTTAAGTSNIMVFSTVAPPAPPPPTPEPQVVYVTEPAEVKYIEVPAPVSDPQVIYIPTAASPIGLEIKFDEFGNGQPNVVNVAQHRFRFLRLPTSARGLTTMQIIDLQDKNLPAAYRKRFDRYPSNVPGK